VLSEIEEGIPLAKSRRGEQSSQNLEQFLFVWSFWPLGKGQCVGVAASGFWWVSLLWTCPAPCRYHWSRNGSVEIAIHLQYILGIPGGDGSWRNCRWCDDFVTLVATRSDTVVQSRIRIIHLLPSQKLMPD
jgi:hypothetical protein